MACSVLADILKEDILKTLKQTTMNKHTSKELSEKLAKAGCELESEKSWITNPNNDNIFLCKNKEHKDANGIWERYTAYDILNDICVKYAKEFFGENYQHRRGEVMDVTETTLGFLQSGKHQEAEDYIWEHCKFNKEINN